MYVRTANVQVPNGNIEVWSLSLYIWPHWDHINGLLVNCEYEQC
jgi:hypothetical protein